MGRARQAEKDPVDGAAARLLTPAELAQVQGEGPLRTAYAELWTAHQQVRQRVEELERRVGLHSRNSGKPPTTDGLAKPPAPTKEPQPKRTRSQRRPSGRRSGGQPGHPGATLRQTEFPDHVETHLPPQGAGCGAPLTESDAAGAPHRRQVFDLPAPPPLEVTEHQAYACRCGACGHLTRAAFPEDVQAPVQYGSRIAALAVYLQTGHFLPEARLVELFGDLFQVRLSAATLARMVRQAAQRWRAPTERLRDWLVQDAEVKHLDETGFRIAGRTQWLHGLSTQAWTFYRTHPRRGSVLEGFQGCLVHDHWQSYFTVPHVRHQLCNAHHLRELQAVLDLDREAWAGRMQRVLRRANLAVRLAGQLQRELRPSLVALLERRYAQVVAEALAYHETQPPLQAPRPKRRGRPKRRPGHNLALRLRNGRESVLRFLHEPAVPFTNNQAEQDVRMMKLRQKISGGFRTVQGAQDFATLRSVLSSARKQGRNRLAALVQGPEVLFAALPP